MWYDYLRDIHQLKPDKYKLPQVTLQHSTMDEIRLAKQAVKDTNKCVKIHKILSSTVNQTLKSRLNEFKSLDLLLVVGVCLVF